MSCPRQDVAVTPWAGGLAIDSGSGKEGNRSRTSAPEYVARPGRAGLGQARSTGGCPQVGRPGVRSGSSGPHRRRRRVARESRHTRCPMCAPSSFDGAVAIPAITRDRWRSSRSRTSGAAKWPTRMRGQSPTWMAALRSRIALWRLRAPGPDRLGILRTDSGEAKSRWDLSPVIVEGVGQNNSWGAFEAIQPLPGPGGAGSRSAMPSDTAAASRASMSNISSFENVGRNRAIPSLTAIRNSNNGPLT